MRQNAGTKAPVSPEVAAEFPKELAWLADAPLFIDGPQVERFYDAVVRPESREGTTTLNLMEQSGYKISAEGGGSLKAGLADWLVKVFPFLRLDAEAHAKGSAEASATSQSGRTVEQTPIITPERQLVALTIHYFMNQRKRIYFEIDPSKPDWRNPDLVREVPRLLVFLELQPGVIIIPTAAEFANGKIVQIYSSLVKENGERPPRYPELGLDLNPEALAKARKGYWKWFQDNFNPTRAMVAVEDAASANGRIRWIDYRVPLTKEGDTLHLHTRPAGNYDTGDFAYNLVKRGFKHGLRLVGTLKSEPDLNVLAIYER